MKRYKLTNGDKVVTVAIGETGWPYYAWWIVLSSCEGVKHKDIEALFTHFYTEKEAFEHVKNWTKANNFEVTEL